MSDGFIPFFGAERMLVGIRDGGLVVKNDSGDLFTVGSDGTITPSGGGASGPIASTTLAAPVAAGASTIQLGAVLPSWAMRDTWIVIGAGTPKAEVRHPLTNTVGTTYTVDPLWVAHSAGETVLLMVGGEASLALWGAVGNGVADDTNAIQAALDQSYLLGGPWITGVSENQTHIITHPVCHSSGARFQRALLSCSGFVGVADVDGAAYMNSNHGPAEFTADAATDTFTITRFNLSGSGVAANVGDKIVFQDPVGQGLPSPIVAGKVYYVKTWSGTGIGATFTVSATSGGATLDLTTNGAGRAYQKINGAGRPFLYDVHLNGNNIPGLNGFRMAIQQPLEVRKIRADNFPGVGLIVDGDVQQGEFYNCEFIACGTGARFTGLGGNVYYLDCEQCAIGLDLQGNDWKFYGPHFEGNTQDVIFGQSSGAQSRADVFYGGYFGAFGTDAAHAPFTVVSGDGASGYQLVGCHFGGAIGAGRIIINDLSSRNKQLLYDNLASIQGELGYLFQPIGVGSWVFLDGSPTFLPKVRTVVTFTSIAAGATQDQTVTVPGAVAGNRVLAAPEAFIGSLLWMAYVSGSNTVTIRMYNPTAGAIDPVDVNWDVSVIQ